MALGSRYLICVEKLTATVQGHILKRLSHKQRLRHRRIMRLRIKKASSFSSVARNRGLTREARDRFKTNRAKLPETPIDFERRKDHASLVPPKVLSLSENFEPTLAFIYDFKRLFAERRMHEFEDGIRRRIYAEFSEIERIAPGAGLVLAAEIHRYSQTRGGRIIIHDEEWDESVRKYFIDTGLFDLLAVDPNEVATKDATNVSARTTLKYLSGRTTRGSDVKDLLNRLQNLAGQSIGTKSTVYNAIAEALANISHAYPDWFRGWPNRTTRRWWASGFWNPSSKTVGLQLYDQGAGIPSTLPKQTYYPKLLQNLDPEGTDAGLIAAAMKYGRTSTGRAGRGKGLAEMTDWIESSSTGFLRILSGSGEVTYRPGKKFEKRNFNANFDGTLVQWELTLA